MPSVPAAIRRCPCLFALPMRRVVAYGDEPALEDSLPSDHGDRVQQSLFWRGA